MEIVNQYLKPFLACAICFLTPYLASYILSGNPVTELMMFFGEMAYMSLLKNMKSKQNKKSPWSDKTKSMIDENLACGERLLADLKRLWKGR